MFKETDYEKNKKRGLSYYIGIFLCIGIITAAGVYYMAYSFGKNELEKAKVPIEEINNNLNEALVSKPENDIKKEEDIKVDEVKENEREQQEQQEEKKELKFIMPVKGEVITPFSDKELIYYKPLSSWTTHQGIDIVNNENTDVSAVEKGIISKVYDDPLMGITIIVRHNDEFSSVYSNLENKDLVYEGKEVNAGDIIGRFSNTSIKEGDIEKHLHFEIIKNGKKINPLDYLK